MSHVPIPCVLPIPETALRDLAKNVAKSLPNFAAEEAASGTKNLYLLIVPVLDTVDLPELETTHRAAASNALCAIIEQCQASSIEYARNAILDDAIWTRLLNIYLKRAEESKGKSMRQLLLLLTTVITKDHGRRAQELRTQAATLFLTIICRQQDRVRVKPALQGLAHFLLRDVVSIVQLVAIYDSLYHVDDSSNTSTPSSVFRVILVWGAHHDTSLSAGHLVKIFLVQARRLPASGVKSEGEDDLPLWVKPVLQTLQECPDRIQEFKTHVFPHCFHPNLDEYVQFLSYLNFEAHIQPHGHIPARLRATNRQGFEFDKSEEFNVLLASIATGKELNVFRDSDHTKSLDIEIRDGAIYVPDDIMGKWMSHPDPKVRLAGMFLSIHSTAITKAMGVSALIALKENLVHLHTENDTSFRREVLGYTQKLFDRLRASTASLAKTKHRVEITSQTRLPLPELCLGMNGSVIGHSHSDPLAESLKFVAWYLNFLGWELRSTASYQRRIAALRSLTIVLRSGIDPGVPHSQLSKSAQGQSTWAHGIQIGNGKVIRTLLDLILDPFDDVRDASISVLQLCLTALPESQRRKVLSNIPSFMSRAETVMLRTGRADQADGVARAYGLLYTLAYDGPRSEGDGPFTSKLTLFQGLRRQLEETLQFAQDSLSDAVNGRPVHGIFAALTFIVDQSDFYSILLSTTGDRFHEWKQAHGHVMGSIVSLWSCINHVLCTDAPEGHVPEELEEESNLDTKEILSYSWRGLKEASTLLRTIISKAPIGTGDRDLLTPEFFEILGQLCFIQLLELRHRGAFSTVSQTFAAFCRRCASSEADALRSLPETWYQQTLRSIQEKSDAITRRSAGIPAVMIALLASESQTGGTLFPRAMRDLIAESLIEARSLNIEESRLPQVHALNCIKEIFTTSRLSVRSEAYIGQVLEVAAKTLNSNIWPIRNCSLMLFKALIERLLGSSEAQDWKEHSKAKTSRFSYDNYPDLVNILQNLLDPEGPLKESIEGTAESKSPFDLHGTEGVFPGLQILRQARPPQEDLEIILSSVERLLASPHWHLRDMAARTVVALRTKHQLRDAAFALLKDVPKSHNMQHGVLLTVKYTFKRILQDSAQFALKDFAVTMEELSKLTEPWYIENICLSVKSTFHDIVSLFGMAMLRRGDTLSIVDSWKTLAGSLEIGQDLASKTGHDNYEASFKTSLAQVVFVDSILIRNDRLDLNTFTMFQSARDALILLAHDNPDICYAILETLETVLQSNGPTGLKTSKCLILKSILEVVATATDLEVLSKAQVVVAGALANSELRAELLGLMPEEDIMIMLAKLESQCLQAPPSNVQSALHLLGLFLDFAYHQFPNQAKIVLFAFARYIRLLRMTVIDTNPFDIRFAAVESLNALEHIWNASLSSKTMRSLILGLSFVLYDLLNDDDDEIQDLAAVATAKLLRAQGNPTSKSTVPIFTAHRLATYLTKSFTVSHDLAREATRRLTNSPSPTALFSIPFATTFALERKEDTALFATEKQNLYKDDTLDAVVWAHVLSGVPAANIPHVVATGLTAWVLDSLALLTSTAETERDGALGWSSKPEIFTLGIRVVYAAEVLLKWGVKERSEVLLALVRFVDFGVKAEVHGLWLERIEKLLAKEVVRTLVRMNKSLMDK